MEKQAQSTQHMQVLPLQLPVRSHSPCRWVFLGACCFLKAVVELTNASMCSAFGIGFCASSLRIFLVFVLHVSVTSTKEAICCHTMWALVHADSSDGLYAGG